MFAVQPVSFGSFDEWGADYTPTIAAAYRIAGQRQADGEGDQMIWRLTTGEPIAWVRVYEDESVDSVTPEALALFSLINRPLSLYMDPHEKQRTQTSPRRMLLRERHRCQG